MHAPNNNPPPVVLGLRTGCCPDPVPGPGGRTVRHLIHGYEYKNATDEQGNYHSGGAERDVPWVAIAPVVNAVRVLERMVPDGHLLFDHHAHDLHMKRPGTGSLKMSALRERIGDFVTWANHEAASHCLTGEVIPADPHGNIGLARFRRSLAWHIARRPAGWSLWPSSTERRDAWLGNDLTAITLITSLIGQAERVLPEMVTSARLNGHTWDEIARAIGTSPDEARLRFDPESPVADPRWPYDL